MSNRKPVQGCEATLRFSGRAGYDGLTFYGASDPGPGTSVVSRTFTTGLDMRYYALLGRCERAEEQAQRATTCMWALVFLLLVVAVFGLYQGRKKNGGVR